jgi:NADH-ubiquinone oxidoreductase chain 5
MEFSSNSIFNFKLSKLGYTIFGFFNQRFLIEMFYNNYITKLVLNLGGQTTKVLDKGSIEYIGPYGLEGGFTKLSKNISLLSTGVVTSYALYILMGVISYLIVIFLIQLSFYLVILMILSLFLLISIK